MTGPVGPGATLGILGGGQLGRMTALAARSLGYSVHALDPDPACPARGVVDRLVTAPFDNPAAADDLAARCDVVTLEIEKIGLASLEAAARRAPLRPAAAALAVVQDRGRQKDWLTQHGFPVGPYRNALAAAEVETAVRALAAPCVVKSTTGGYDGRSQVPVTEPAGAGQAWRALGGRPCVVEALLDLEREISVLVARRPSGESAVYPPALNHHAERILDWSVIPAPLRAGLGARAERLGRDIAEALGVEGLLAVEMFVVKGELLVNELAPRPHNSFHHTEVACVTSQFEQAVRAVCDLPLGSVQVVRPAALVNLLGDLWLGPKPPAFEEVLALPGVKLFLYGKQEARPGRKMGHLCAVGSDPEQAVERAREARERLA